MAGREGEMRRSKTNTGTAIVALPNPIMSDILSRLPLKSIFICRRVCKLWRNLILEPYFAKLHLPRSPPSLIIYRHGNSTNNSASYFEIVELHDPPLISLPNATMKFKTEIYFPHVDIRTIASCNGSILLSNCKANDDPVIIVCNPLRAQHLILPKPPKLARQTHMFAGLGFVYSPATDQYKVLRFTTQTGSPATLWCDIFTIGIEDEWRRIGDTGKPPFCFPSQFVFLNGALHWLGFENSWIICYFNIVKEQFGSFPLPSHLGTSIAPINGLGVADNKLYIYRWHPSNVRKFWVMKDYGHVGSWTWECFIDGPFPGGLGTGKPLKMLKDGTLLMMFSKCTKVSGLSKKDEFITVSNNPREKIIEITLASYNPQTREVEKMMYRGILPCSASVAGVPSFFSLMDASVANILCFFSPMDALK